MQRVNYEIVSRLLVRQHYEIALQALPDVLTVADIAAFTGYGRHTVSRWCSEGRLKVITRSPKFIVPKSYLLDFLISDDYNNICRKSKRHYAMIQSGE